MRATTTAIGRIYEIKLAWVLAHTNIADNHIRQPVYLHIHEDALVVDGVRLKSYYSPVGTRTTRKEDRVNTHKAAYIEDCLSSEAQALKERILRAEVVSQMKRLAKA